MHTPGHTPDSLSLYDPEERTLFVGDTLYENTAITFPAQGDPEAYRASLDKLLAFVHMEGGGVKVAAGRGVWGVDAGALVGFVKELVERVLIGGGVRVIKCGEEKATFFGPERAFEESVKMFSHQ